MWWRLKSTTSRLFAQLFVQEQIKNIKLTGLCEGNPPLTGGFPSQRVSEAKNGSIWWRHHDNRLFSFDIHYHSVPIPVFDWFKYLCAICSHEVLHTTVYVDAPIHPCSNPDDVYIMSDSKSGILGPGCVEPGPRFNIKMPSNQCRKSHCGDKTVVRSSYLHNGISYTGKTTYLYWIKAQGPNWIERCYDTLRRTQTMISLSNEDSSWWQDLVVWSSTSNGCIYGHATVIACLGPGLLSKIYLKPFPC